MTDEREALREALKHTAVALKHGQVPFALGGGYASWALGGPEPEHDVDFVVAEHDQERAATVLEEAGLQVERPPEDWLFKVFREGAMVDVIHRIAGVPVEPELLERARDTEVLSVHMPVLEATDLLAGKMQALSEHACDYGKVLPSARALREQVDWDRLSRQVEDNPFAVAFLELARRLGVAPG
jgi:predicted nucleotidyltransferase